MKPTAALTDSGMWAAASPRTPPLMASGATSSTENALPTEPSAMNSSTNTTRNENGTITASRAERPLLVLELAAPDEVVAFGHLHVALHRRDAVGDDRAQVAAFDVELERQDAAVGLAGDGGLADRLLDAGDLAQRHMSAAGRRHEDVADPRFVLALGHREDQANRHRPLVLPVRRRDGPAERGLDDVLGGIHVDAGARQRSAVEHDLQLRHARIAIEPEVDDARHLAERRRRTARACSS